MAWIELHQELREHRKIYACAESLKISRVTMVGTIVSLWLWALDNMPDGSLDGVSNRTIARVCDFPEKKADTFVKELASAGWLDKKGDTYVIHDWDEYVGKLMDRRKKDRERKKKSADIPQEFPRKSAEIPALQYPNSTITVQNQKIESHNNEGYVPEIPAPESHADEPADENAPFSGKLFTVFWDAYPRRIDRNGAWEAWKALRPDQQTGESILASLEAWKRSNQWTDDGGRFIPEASKFLYKEYWRATPPPPQAKGMPKGASGTLGAAELENIQRLLRED